MDSLQQQLLPHLRGELGERLRNTILFYPHCQRDLHYPVTLFAPWVPNIWFADLVFFRSPNEAADIAPRALRAPGYKLLDVTIVGPPTISRVPGNRPPPGQVAGDIEPCIRTETYLHRQSGRTFRVHRRRGFSVSGFRSLIDQPLGVFFYRGDSRDGSNVPWLTFSSGRAFFGEVLDRLVDGGLLVTDGSRMENHRTVRKYRNICDCRPVEFNDHEGRRFVPLTNGDNDRDRRLVVWQVFKPTVAAAEE